MCSSMRRSAYSESLSGRKTTLMAAPGSPPPHHRLRCRRAASQTWRRMARRRSWPSARATSSGSVGCSVGASGRENVGSGIDGVGEALTTCSTRVERRQAVGHPRDLGQRRDVEHVGRPHAHHGDVAAAELVPYVGVVLHRGIVERQDALDGPLDADVPSREAESRTVATTYDRTTVCG